MKHVGRALRALPALGMLILAGCGGGSAPAAMLPAQSPGIQIGEPAPGLFDTSAHLRQAASAQCADSSNKLYLVNNQYVFWERSGNCPDNSYGQTLMGSNASAPLCTAGDSIAGPMVQCSDNSVKAMFDTMRANLGKPDLGLGSAYTVKQIEVPAKPGAAVSVETLEKGAFSGVTAPQNVVIRNADDLARIWAQHTSTVSPRPELPRVDFSREMVLALFAGTSTGCQEFEVNRVSNAGEGILVEYIDRDINAQTICVAAITSPMQMIKVPLSTLKVTFQRMHAEFLNFETINTSKYAPVLGAPDGEVVIKDSAAFEREWALRSNSDTVKPAINFDKQMVIAVFGTGTDGCQGMGIKNLYRSTNTIYVNIVRSRPAPDSMLMCTLAITHPSHWIVVDKSDEPVVFMTQTRYYR